MRVRGLKDLAASSRRLVTEVKHLEGRYGGRPAAGSRAAVEANDTALGNPLWGERPIEASDLHVVLLLASAGDHLMLLSQGLVDRTASLVTAGRGCLESAAKAAWLADVTLSTHRRTGLWFNELVLAIHQQAWGLQGYADFLPEHAVEAADRRQYLELMLQAAEAHGQWGMVTRPGKPWKAPYVGEQPSSATSLVDRLLTTPDNAGPRFGRAVYQVGSAVAHANAHGFSVAGLVNVEEDGLSYPGTPLTVREVAIRHLPVIGGFFNATCRVVNRLGWNIDNVRWQWERTYQQWSDAAGGE